MTSSGESLRQASNRPRFNYDSLPRCPVWQRITSLVRRLPERSDGACGPAMPQHTIVRLLHG